jgi:hypothetical protein
MKDTLIITVNEETKKVLLALLNSIYDNELDLISVKHEEDSLSTTKFLTIKYRERYV